MTDKRETGYYWVLDNYGEWQVARWDASWCCWYTIGYDGMSFDVHFAMIGPQVVRATS